MNPNETGCAGRSGDCRPLGHYGTAHFISPDSVALPTTGSHVLNFSGNVLRPETWQCSITPIDVARTAPDVVNFLTAGSPDYLKGELEELPGFVNYSVLISQLDCNEHALLFKALLDYLIQGGKGEDRIVVVKCLAILATSTKISPDTAYFILTRRYLVPDTPQWAKIYIKDVVVDMLVNARLGEDKVLPAVQLFSEDPSGSFHILRKLKQRVEPKGTIVEILTTLTQLYGPHLLAASASSILKGCSAPSEFEQVLDFFLANSKDAASSSSPLCMPKVGDALAGLLCTTTDDRDALGRICLKMVANPHLRPQIQAVSYLAEVIGWLIQGVLDAKTFLKVDPAVVEFLHQNRGCAQLKEYYLGAYTTEAEKAELRRALVHHNLLIFFANF